jgi:hypothetical protein
MTCPQDCVATGKVTRIYTSEQHTSYRLDSPVQPGGGHYFVLSTSHPNYNSLFSLALAAATNERELQIRTQADISPAADADVLYMVVDL